MMSVDVCYADQIVLGKQALEDPQPGDRWSEMFSCNLFVVGRVFDRVLVLHRFTGDTAPDDGTPAVWTLEEFKAHLTYANSEQTWMRLVQRGINVGDWWKGKFKVVAEVPNETHCQEDSSGTPSVVAVDAGRG